MVADKTNRQPAAKSKTSSIAGPSPSKQWSERVFLSYSPVWIAVLAAIVKLKLYESFTAETYLFVGVATAAPCVLIPLLCDLLWTTPDSGRPLFERHWFKVNLWIAIVGYIGNHFYTHYFYQVLGMRYTVPTDGWTINGVPVCMYLLTHPYFCSYHSVTTQILRAIRYKTPAIWRTGVLCAAITGIAYITAFMETYTISGFPHYTYPDWTLMLTVGSAFYAMLFLATFPLFARLDECSLFDPIETPSRASPLSQTMLDAFAAAMIAFCLFDVWRLAVGPFVSFPAPVVNVDVPSVPFAQ
ncbi:cyclopropyl isomerase [Capsaspora owczarzaki ATCC 30864]|uniref:Cyclopropyl isomerase n=1 Tax=Capsaspora owczarzaki (strain ATCC 30864) TaxID=595528 RepID=A0A0D2X488_CAPO3|nr:cyclopropyl isomerase [Capsaspora owczarzaki ATCC 30864]KJE95634.1 cyclopropyl isomerase [Capsaspora owczarzaki ATCC 30864]|eukprot:XP_004345655.1 cyclopropyl isomerase [Capsaspora owczarzaki ATCC 30864]